MSLNDRSQNSALENAIAHAQALLFRTSCGQDATYESKRKDVDAALALANGVSSFLNLQSHVKASRQNEVLVQRTHKTFELAATAENNLRQAQLSVVGVRRSADMLVKERAGAEIVLVGALGMGGGETRVFVVWSDGEVLTYKHLVKEGM
jgi:hypothetical protein